MVLSSDFSFRKRTSQNRTPSHTNSPGQEVGREGRKGEGCLCYILRNLRFLGLNRISLKLISMLSQLVYQLITVPHLGELSRLTTTCEEIKHLLPVSLWIMKNPRSGRVSSVQMSQRDATVLASQDPHRR